MAVDDTGCVDSATVLEVMECHTISIGPDPDYPEQTIFAKGSKIDSRVLPDWCDRDVLQYFSRTFGIPITHFYHPEWARQMVQSGRRQS
jgi:hypothetical protein